MQLAFHKMFWQDQALIAPFKDGRIAFEQSRSIASHDKAVKLRIIVSKD